MANNSSTDVVSREELTSERIVVVFKMPQVRSIHPDAGFGPYLQTILGIKGGYIPTFMHGPDLKGSNLMSSKTLVTAKVIKKVFKDGGERIYIQLDQLPPGSERPTHQMKVHAKRDQRPDREAIVVDVLEGCIEFVPYGRAAQDAPADELQVA